MRDEHADYELPHDFWLEWLERLVNLVEIAPDEQEWHDIKLIDSRHLDCIDQPLPFGAVLLDTLRSKQIPVRSLGQPDRKPGRPDCKRCDGTGEMHSHGVMRLPLENGNTYEMQVSIPLPCACTK